MAKALFTNNASGTLASAIASTGATSLALTAGQGALFPTITGSDYFYATIIDASNNKEIVKVTANAADTFTMVRAQDNTTARTFAIASRVELRPTAIALTEKVATGDIHATNLTALGSAPTGTGSNVLSASPTFTGTLSAAILSTSGSISGASNLSVAGIAAVHTTIGGWSGSANFEVLSGNSGETAVSGVCGTGGYCFSGRTDTTGGNFAGWNYNGSYIGGITTNGTSVSYNTSSDRRLKTNIIDAPDAGAIIDALRVRSWDWKSDASHERYGFVAQEEVLVAPFAVRAGDSNPDTITEQWGRDDAKLVPLLVKEIQSLRARLAALEAA